MTEARGRAAVWTCPLCPLLCDDLRPPATAAALDCALARQRLAPLLSTVPEGPAMLATLLDGTQVALDPAALDQAAQWLAAARHPLVGGLGCDVAAARALVPLAALTSASCDAADGEGLAAALRVQQDRGGYTATLAEVQARADLIVMVGSWPLTRAPRLLERLLAARATPPSLCVLAAPDAPTRLTVGARTEAIEHVAAAGDGATQVAQLAACVRGHHLLAAAPALEALAARLHAARYAVLVWEPGQLGAAAAPMIEAMQGIIAVLNQRTRAAGLVIGGGLGAGTAQQVSTWLTGQPLRTRLSPQGYEHDSRRFGADRLIADRAVDLLLWINAFGTHAPPAFDGPRLVLGPPAMEAAWMSATRGAAPALFIPVATPGVQTAGHLFRTDGVVLMPLHPCTERGRLPSVAQVLEALRVRLVRHRGTRVNSHGVAETEQESAP